MNLSKSAFIRGLQCHKSLYLKKFHPELEDEISESQQAIFDGGTNVGLLAQQLFPGGIDLGRYIPSDFDKAYRETDRLIAEKQDVIYEAGFKYENLTCFMDILTKKDDKYYAYEVKGSTEVKDVYLWDTAFQYHVITSSGIELEDISVVYLNTDYVRNGELDIPQLFTVESVKDRILPLLPKVKEHAKQMKLMLSHPASPDIKISPHCSDPYGCSFTGHCWKDVPDNSIFSYKGIKGITKWELFNSDILLVEDIPDNYTLNNTEQLVVSSTKNNASYVNAEAIKSFVSGLNYPLYFLDFETLFMVSVPIYNHSRPFQQIPFQYSLHIKKSNDSNVEHLEFLADATKGIDPRIGFIENLIQVIGTAGDIIVYNATFEKGRLQEIKALFPQYTVQIDNMSNRIVDLMSPFRSRYYYTPDMKGSYSIKKVLPALVPKLSYEGMAIADGGAASTSFMRLFEESDPAIINQTRKDLLKYCELDTLAMVEILKVLKETIQLL
jgi:hypothetical protein